MLVVALAGLVMGGGVWGYRMWRLSGEYARMAESDKSFENAYRTREWLCLQSELDGKKSVVHSSREERRRINHMWVPESREAAPEYAKIAAYYAALARKYEQAARYP
jgi:hypothetical protein